MNNLEQILNQKTEDKYDFKIKSVNLTKSTGLCLVEIFYKDGIILSKKDREYVESELISMLPSGFKYQIKFIKNFVVNENVIDKIKFFFSHNFPSIFYDIAKIDCEKDLKLAVVEIDKAQMDYAQERNLKGQLEDFLFENFNIKIDVTVEENKEKTLEEIEVFDDDLPDFEPVVERFIEVDNVTPFIGDITDNKAFYIKDKTEPGTDVVFCGKVQYFKEHEYNVMSKRKQDDEGTVITKYFYKFLLQGFTGKINCVFFANKLNVDKIRMLEDDNEIIVQGQLEEDKFNNGVSLRVKDISMCTLPETFEEYIAYKSEPKAYRYVFPEEYVNYSQTDLFSANVNYPDFVKNNTFVVFDFETTGLEVINGDKIVEIGAVKIKDGKIVEKFSALINPEMKIPVDSIKIHGIHDSDVKDSPTYDKMIPDFYKFTRGAILSGYNVSFDYGFLNHFGKLCGYNFDNPLLDIYKIAQKNIKGLKKYKLKPVAEHLGVALDNAHRAVYDTIATAEVFLKLADFYDDGWIKK